MRGIDSLGCKMRDKTARAEQFSYFEPVCDWVLYKWNVKELVKLGIQVWSLAEVLIGVGRRGECDDENGDEYEDAYAGGSNV